MRVAKRTGHTEARATGKPQGTRPAAFQGQGVLMVTGTPEAGTRRAAVKPGHRTARAPAGARTAVPRKPAGRKAAARRRSAGRRGHAAAHGRRRAASRRAPRPAARRAPVPAPQASTPKAVPARGAGTAPLRATHHPHGGVAPAGQAGASAAGSAGSAKTLPPAEPAGAPGGYAEGYRDGVFAGGEALVAQHIPPDHILPAVAAADLIAAGFRQYAPSSPVWPAPTRWLTRSGGAGCTAPLVGRSPRRWRTADAGSRYGAARRAGAGAGTVPALRRGPALRSRDSGCAGRSDTGCGLGRRSDLAGAHVSRLVISGDAPLRD